MARISQTVQDSPNDAKILEQSAVRASLQLHLTDLTVLGESQAMDYPFTEDKILLKHAIEFIGEVIYPDEPKRDREHNVRSKTLTLTGTDPPLFTIIDPPPLQVATG